MDLGPRALNSNRVVGESGNLSNVGIDIETHVPSPGLSDQSPLLLWRGNSQRRRESLTRAIVESPWCLAL